MKIERIAQDIHSFELFSPAQCRRFVALLDRRTDWRTARTLGPEGEKTAGRLRRCGQIPASRVPALQRELRSGAGRVLKSVAALCWKYTARSLHGAYVLRYRPGGFYKRHYDSAVPGSRGRVISVVCYLNDDFRGGRLVFDLQKCVVRPRPGMALLFPSGITHPHAAEKVVSGTKYVLIAWLN